MPVSRSRDVIEALLVKIGAVGFRWDSNLPYRENGSRQLVKGWDAISARIKWQGRDLSFRMGIQWRDQDEQKIAMRALYWCLKAKVEAIQFGIVDLEQEFLPYLLDKSGEHTIYEALRESGFKMLPEGRDVPEGLLP